MARHQSSWSTDTDLPHAAPKSLERTASGDEPRQRITERERHSRAIRHVPTIRQRSGAVVRVLRAGHSGAVAVRCSRTVAR